MIFGRIQEESFDKKAKEIYQHRVLYTCLYPAGKSSKNIFWYQIMALGPCVQKFFTKKGQIWLIFLKLGRNFDHTFQTYLKFRIGQNFLVDRTVDPLYHAFG